MNNQNTWLTSVSDEELVNIQKRWQKRKENFQKELVDCQSMLIMIHSEKAERGLFREQNRQWLEEFKKMGDG